VRKSQKILGQKKPSIDAAIWSVGMFVSYFATGWLCCEDGILTGSCGEDDETRPVVLDQSTHDVLWIVIPIGSLYCYDVIKNIVESVPRASHWCVLAGDGGRRCSSLLSLCECMLCFQIN
jgi:hypothetical protein